MKKIFTLVAMALMAVGANAQDYRLDGDGTIGSATGTYTLPDGSTIDAPGNIVCGDIPSVLLKDGKAYSSGMDITYNDEMFKTLKLSNGAWNMMTLPAGVTIIKVEVIGYSNDSSNNSWISNLGAYKSGVYEDAFTADGTGEVLPMGKDNTNISKITIDNLSLTGNVYFKNGGKQPCMIMNLYKGQANGVNNIKVEDTANSNKMYNLSGQLVDKSYKGVVISNGKKLIVK